jgi:hypothetical protein
LTRFSEDRWQSKRGAVGIRQRSSATPTPPAPLTPSKLADARRCDQFIHQILFRNEQ